MKVWVAAGAAAVALTLAGACVDSGVENYEDFKSALDKGVTCAELFDQRETIEGQDDLELVNRDLERIGCENRNSERNDR